MWFDIGSTSSRGGARQKNYEGPNYKLKGSNFFIIIFIKYLQGRGISLQGPGPLPALSPSATAPDHGVNQVKYLIKKNIDKIKSYLHGWIFDDLFNLIKPDTNLIKSILINFFYKKTKHHFNKMIHWRSTN